MNLSTTEERIAQLQREVHAKFSPVTHWRSGLFCGILLTLALEAITILAMRCLR